MNIFLGLLVIYAVITVTGIAGLYFYGAAKEVIHRAGDPEPTDCDGSPLEYLMGLTYLFWAGISTQFAWGPVTTPTDEKFFAVILITALIVAVIMVLAITKATVLFLRPKAKFRHCWNITPSALS